MHFTGQTLKQAPQRMHSLLSIQMAPTLFHSFASRSLPQLPSASMSTLSTSLMHVARRHFDAGAAVDAAVDVDLVFQVAQVAALRFLLAGAGRQADIDLQRRASASARRAEP